MYIDLFPLGNGTWELQAENVCYGAKGKSYGVIKLKEEGLLIGIKLKHFSGNLTCDVRYPQHANLWGCNFINYTSSVLTVVTDNGNWVVFPANMKNTRHFYVPGFNPKTSNILVFTNLAYPKFFNEVQELRIWYTEDLYHYSTSDNGGVHCVNVYVKFGTAY